MNKPEAFSEASVAFVGLGLMGGSLAMALRPHFKQVLACDPDPNSRELALQTGLVDRAAAEPDEILAEAAVIILAAPVRAILGTIDRIPDLHPGGAVVMDLGSTKRAISGRLATLPERFEALPAHPLCGKTEAGLLHADPAIFAGAPFVFCETPRTRERARALAALIVAATGARPLWIDPELHDRWAARTSHAPALLAAALVTATPPDALALAGPGFRSSTRLAKSGTAMIGDITATNRAECLAALADIRREIERLEALLVREDREGFDSYWEQARRSAQQL